MQHLSEVVFSALVGFSLKENDRFRVESVDSGDAGLHKQ
jgi:hypothetical protein